MTLGIMLIQYLISLHKKQINNADIVLIDSEANKGLTSPFFGKYFSKIKIYAFELRQKLFQDLTEKFKDTLGIKILRQGGSISIGQLFFDEIILSITSVLERLNFNSAYVRPKIKFLRVKPLDKIKAECPIKFVRLSNFLANHKTRKIDIPKINIGGYWYRCSQGLFYRLGTEVDYIQPEYYNDSMYFNIYDFSNSKTILQQNGFSLHIKKKHEDCDFDELVGNTFYNNHDLS